MRPALADLIDLLGTKWVMRILWELRDGSLSFRALQSACGGISPSVLNQRLELLESAGLLLRGQTSGYSLNEHGQSLVELHYPLAAWAQAWQDRQLNTR